MEQVVFCSKNDLAELNETLLEKSSLKQIVFYQEDAISYLGILPEDVEEASFFIADWINQCYGAREVMQSLMEYFDYLTQDEFMAVKQTAMHKLLYENKPYLKSLQESLCRLAEVSYQIHLDGFMVFGMQEYRKQIRELIETCLDEYLAEEDYQEFLHLLQYFISLEESQQERLYVITNPDGSYRFYDEAHREITESCRRMFLEEFPEIETPEEEMQNDILISLLVILLPEKIYIYGSQYIANKNFLATLQTVFETRIQFQTEYPGFLPL